MLAPLAFDAALPRLCMMHNKLLIHDLPNHPRSEGGRRQVRSRSKMLGLPKMKTLRRR